MENLASSKLVDLAKILTNKEWKDLEYWLKAPWTKNEPKVVALYDLLFAHYPGFKAKYLKKTQLYQQLFPTAAYDNRQFNYLIRKLTETLEAYLGHLRLQKHKSTRQNAVRELLLERQQLKHFEEYSLHLLKDIAAKSAKSADDFLRCYQINRDLYYQPSSHRRYQADPQELQGANDALNEFFLLEKYCYLHEIARRSKVLQQPMTSTSPVLQAYLNHLRSKYISMPAALYEFKLQQATTDWTVYLEFKQLFAATWQQLPRRLQQDFLFSCINDAVAFVSKGNDLALQELAYWYQWGMEKDLLSQHNTITGVTFNNFILTACHFDNIDLIENFIKTYQNKLPLDLRRAAKCWAWAHLDYVKDNYASCIEKLEGRKLPKQAVYAIQTKLTLLKAHFKWVLADTSQGKRFHYYCKSLEQYLHRNSPYSEDRSQAILRCVQLIKRIVALKAGKEYLDQQQVEKLKKAIDDAPNLFGKSWLKKELALLTKVEISSESP